MADEAISARPSLGESGVAGRLRASSSCFAMSDRTAASGAARSAGVEVGDYLLRVGDIAVSDPDFGTRYRARYARRDGDRVPLVVRRGTEERTLTLPVRNRLRTVETVAFDRNASPKALRVRAGILKGQ